MSQLSQDLRYAGRTLSKRPRFTAFVVLTLGMGIGATAAIFRVVNAVILKPLPFREPDRVMRIAETKGRGVRYRPGVK
jgi:putative ABC transport system permease protein